MSVRTEAIRQPARRGGLRRRFSDRWADHAVSAYELGELDALGVVAHLDWIANEARAEWPEASHVDRVTRLLVRLGHELVEEDWARIQRERFAYITHGGDRPMPGTGARRRYELAHKGLLVVGRRLDDVTLYHASTSYDSHTGMPSVEWPALGGPAADEVSGFHEAWGLLAREYEAGCIP